LSTNANYYKMLKLEKLQKEVIKKSRETLASGLVQFTILIIVFISGNISGLVIGAARIDPRVSAAELKVLNLESGYTQMAELLSKQDERITLLETSNRSLQDKFEVFLAVTNK
jgi:hypothetical protein